MAFSELEFQEFHDFTLSCVQPMGTVLVSERVKCRKCDKPLGFRENKSSSGHLPHISWDLHGEPPNQTLSNMPDTRTLRPMVNPRSKVQYFDASTLKLPFLLSTEDTAFDMILLSECSNLLWIGAVPFSTFATALIVDLTTEGPRTRQMLKVRRLRRREENGRTNYLLS